MCPPEKRIAILGDHAHQVAAAAIGNIPDGYAFYSAERLQPSPTGDDGDPALMMKPVPKPRMQIGSAHLWGWDERQVNPVDPTEERE